MSLPRVVVVGGGITGLAAAHYLLRIAQDGPCGFEVVVLEAEARAGGKLRTERCDGFLVEAGPDSFLTGKPAACELCRELGIAEALIPQQEPRAAYVARRGRLVPIPPGMRLVHPARPCAFLRSPLLSLPGRIRALAHPLVRASRSGDESVGAFVQRRYGAELLRVLGEPLLAGIHLADPWRLSLEATFPALRASVRRARPGAPAPEGLAHLRGSPFASLEGGVQQLVDALRTRLDGCLEVAAPVTSIVPEAGGYRVHLRCGGRDPLSAAAVVVTTPAAAAANLVRTANPGLAELLAGAEAASSAIVTLGYRDPRVALPLAGSGFLVPRDENGRLLACTWSSAKWAGRAPAGGVLLRGFLGGWRHPELLDLGDGELIALLQDELSVTLGGSFARSVQPAVSRVHRWPAGTPLYRVGHADWLARVRSACAASPGLWLAGAPYDGAGIPDCVRQARETAARVASYLPGGVT